jgi:hypothetical protein
MTNFLDLGLQSCGSCFHHRASSFLITVNCVPIAAALLPDLAGPSLALAGHARIGNKQAFRSQKDRVGERRDPNPAFASREQGAV